MCLSLYILEECWTTDNMYGIKPLFSKCIEFNQITSMMLDPTKEYDIIEDREMLRLQYFYNKSQVVSYYWFKFETNTKIIFLSQQ